MPVGEGGKKKTSSRVVTTSASLHEASARRADLRSARRAPVSQVGKEIGFTVDSHKTLKDY